MGRVSSQETSDVFAITTVTSRSCRSLHTRAHECAPVRVNSYLERGTDFSRYRTYNWGPPDSWTRAILASTTIHSSRNWACTDVEKQLFGTGFEKTTSETPELRLHYHASVTQRIDATAVDAAGRHCDRRLPGLPCTRRVRSCSTSSIPDQQGGVARLGRRKRGRHDRQPGMDGGAHRQSRQADTGEAAARVAMAVSRRPSPPRLGLRRRAEDLAAKEKTPARNGTRHE